jgi:hypothetical protein
MFDNPRLQSTAWRHGNYFSDYFFSSAGGAGMSVFFSSPGAPGFASSPGFVASGLAFGGVLGGQPRVNTLALNSNNSRANFFI